jgi:hypothetical protein
MYYECKNNFLPNNQFAFIKKTITDTNFPWYKFNDLNCFRHSFYLNGEVTSPYISLIDCFKDQPNKPLIRATAFFIPPMKEEYEIISNRQLLNNDETILTYHVNTNDGHTILPSINKWFESIQNRAIFTDANISLAETCPVTYGSRIFFTFLFKNYDLK